MSDFNPFKLAIAAQFAKMKAMKLFSTAVTKDALWETYLSSFPEGSNPMFRERTEHDCQCCKQFIRACGSLVAIDDNLQTISIWDIDVGGDYQVVADAMAALVKSQEIENIYRHDQKNVGTDFNHQLLEDGETLKWEHFYIELPASLVMSKDDMGSLFSRTRSNKDVLKRGLVELSLDAANTIVELIEQNSLYRGEEHKAAVEDFIAEKQLFDEVAPELQDNYCWLSDSYGIRNTVIGSLLVDLSNDVELSKAVKMFDVKVAPTNYKRPTALVTKSMISNAQKKVAELGIEPSLPRRFATIDDITINNVVWANRTAKAKMSVFDEMAADIPTSKKQLDKVEEVDINTFMDTILPKAETIELMLENKHTNNLMSLIAPVNADAPNILKWDNNFSWAYNGEVADSMKERVKKAGGKVDGVLRFSIQWNDGDNNQNDFDAHCIEPNRNLIYYSRKSSPSSCGRLDVDITRPGNKIAVENITWADTRRMLEGKHEFLVHNFSHNGGTTGFTAEIEFDGNIFTYTYNQNVRNKAKIKVANVTFSKKDGFKIEHILPSTETTREVWGISTNQFHPVKVIMNSPNHWDGMATGNRHFFFMLESCRNNEKARGFFNEFLKEDLRDHRKVFEVLGSKMKADPTENQLSGLGFSSTQKNQIICKVTGSFSRTIKINF